MDKQSIDKQDMAKAIYDFPDQLDEALNIGKKFSPVNKFKDIRNIVVAGMGGSAIGGDVCRVLLAKELTVPFVVNRNYALPNWVNEHTLVICSSYSGNTEESLSAYEDAEERDAMICGISTGGVLSEKLQENGHDVISIPAGLQPRAALAYSFVPMLFHLIQQDLIKESVLNDINETIKLLRSKRDEYSTENVKNPAVQLAKNIYTTIPIIYGTSDSTAIAAIRLKGQFSENAKMLAYYNELPEMNHNEIMGWENNANGLKHLCVLWLKDEKDHDRIQLRQGITQKIIEEKIKNQHTIQVDGSSANSRFLHMIHFGDWVSYWCAILHETDPTPVAQIMFLKDELSKER